MIIHEISNETLEDVEAVKQEETRRRCECVRR
jgi:hypothetical protein